MKQTKLSNTPSDSTTTPSFESGVLEHVLRAHLDALFELHPLDMRQEAPSIHLHPLLMKEFERILIQLVLERTHSNQSFAADLLGINRNTLRKKIKEFGLS